MEKRQQIINNIIEITEENKKIDIENILLEFSKHKYSSTKNETWHIVLNGINISRRNKYVFKYKCITCNLENSVKTIQFLRKIINGSENCDLCKNKEDHKRSQQSQFMKGNTINKGVLKFNKPIIIKSLTELKEESLALFDTYDINFKTNYFKTHLSESDYKRISKNLISFQNSKFDKIIDYDFWPIYKVSNQMIFTSIIYDKKTNIVIKIDNPILKCDVCEKNWRAKSLVKFKNDIKITCKDCSLVNKTFRIRKTYNCDNKLILYQSKLELKFINWCNTMNIKLLNGPIIPYIFNNINRKYKVDFQIKKILIEIKDNHIWHQNDIKSGKWQAKEDAVKQLIKINQYDDYYLINPDNWEDYLYRINKI
jgi:hypothetical protein